VATEGVAYRCAVLTVSTGCAQGWRTDTSGMAVRELLEEAGFIVAATAVVPDELEAIQAILLRWSDEQDIPLIVTTGGTGVAPSDITPEATRPLLHREVPGIAEAMRAKTLEQTPMAMISRGVSGMRGRSLLLNLPGSPKGVRECLSVVTPVLSHALALIRQDPTTH
jgi:molybdopterin adenylyltransferase